MTIDIFPKDPYILEQVVKHSREMLCDRDFIEVQPAPEDEQECELWESPLLAYFYRRVRRRNGQVVRVLLLIERQQCKEKAQLDERNEQLRYLFTDSDYTYCVYVHASNSLKPIQRRLIETAAGMEGCIQYFPYCFFYINITRHQLQPLFTPITNSSHPALKERQKLPKLLWEDPIRRYYNYKAGTVVQVVRHGRSTIQQISYRVVAPQSSGS